MDLHNCGFLHVWLWLTKKGRWKLSWNMLSLLHISEHMKDMKWINFYIHAVEASGVEGQSRHRVGCWGRAWSSRRPCALCQQFILFYFGKNLQHRKSDCVSSIVPSTTLLRNKTMEHNGNEERIEPSMEEVLAVPLPASPPTEPSN